MCHLVLLMPVFGLAVFLFLPLPVAVAAYLVIVAMTVLLYRAIYHAMCRPVVTGKEAMLGARASVTRVDLDRLVVCLRGELWTADPAGFTGGVPQPGEQVLITKIRGNRLVVGPASENSSD
ncbi:MAG TPA: NfeD family protein [Thermoleophilia bacterium]|nr:NfeD family protein [Thermoleophilia bacterium]